MEIRRELFTESELQQLPQLAAAIAEHRLNAFYSVPDALFTAQGELNPQLGRYLQEADQLGASLLKLSLGHYRPGAEAGLASTLTASKAGRWWKTIRPNTARWRRSRHFSSSAIRPI